MSQILIKIKKLFQNKIFLNIGGKRWFDGKMGVFQKNKAVRIDKTYVLSDMENMQDEGERQ